MVQDDQGQCLQTSWEVPFLQGLRVVSLQGTSCRGAAPRDELCSP